MTANERHQIQLPVFQKGAIKYVVTTEGKAFPLIWKSKSTGPYRNSRKPLPESMPYGYYLGKQSKVDKTDLDFVEAATFEVNQGFTRLVQQQ